MPWEEPQDRMPFTADDYNDPFAGIISKQETIVRNKLKSLGILWLSKEDDTDLLTGAKTRRIKLQYDGKSRAISMPLSHFEEILPEVIAIQIHELIKGEDSDG